MARGLAAFPAAMVRQELALWELEEALRREFAPPLPTPMELSLRAGITPDPWQADVLSSTAPRILINCSRQSGKSLTVATLALHTALYTPDSLVLLVSKGLRQSSELFHKCTTAYRVTRRPEDPQPVQSSALQLHFANGSRIISLPGKDEDSVRSYSAVRLLVLDEAAFISDPLYYTVRPMLAVSHGRLIALSTPHGKRGWWHAAWEKGGAQWERYKITAAECPRFTTQFLAEELDTMGPWWFSQEYQCQFIESETQAFTEAEVTAAFVAGAQIEQWGQLFGDPAHA